MNSKYILSWKHSHWKSKFVCLPRQSSSRIYHDNLFCGFVSYVKIDLSYPSASRLDIYTLINVVYTKTGTLSSN